MLFCQQVKVQGLICETDQVLARIYYNLTHFRVSTKPGFESMLKASETLTTQAKSALADGNADLAMSFAVQAGQSATDCLGLFTR